jgi:hypothetical protein
VSIERRRVRPEWPSVRHTFSSCFSLLGIIAAALVPVHAEGGEARRMAPAQIEVCHGYGCKYRSRVALGASDAGRFASILAAGRKSPQAERAAMRRAVADFEQRSFAAIGIRDQPKSRFGASGIRGQMDCIDESTNTRAFLRYLAERNLLRYHTVARNASRGLLIDGRYFHSTAVITDQSGVKWAVDSWYAPMGGAPDILPLDEWSTQGGL